MLLFISILYSIFITLYSSDNFQTSLFYKENLDKCKQSLDTCFDTNAILTASPIPTARPLKNPYQGNEQIEKQIWADLGGDTRSELKIINLINNYAFITEHALPPGGGGGWGVAKKINGKWERVFNSQDEVFCILYEKYNLPKWLLGECSV